MRQFKMSFDFVPEIVQQNPWLFGGIAATTIVGLYLIRVYRKWIAGGVCTSKARLDGKTVIITGANSGIGLEAAVDVAKRNARVILACRSVERGKAAVTDVKKRSGNNNVAFVQLDLGSLNSVRAFAAKILEDEPRIDILINNAGVMMLPKRILTSDGFEMQFGVNHLGHFLLTNLLLDRIKETPRARIVILSSAAQGFAEKLDFDNLNCERNYSVTGSYFASKLENVLFTQSLAKRLEGTGVTTNAVDPGAINTGLQRHLHFPLVSLHGANDYCYVLLLILNLFLLCRIYLYLYGVHLVARLHCKEPRLPSTVQ